MFSLARELKVHYRSEEMFPLVHILSADQHAPLCVCASGRGQHPASGEITGEACQHLPEPVITNCKGMVIFNRNRSPALFCSLVPAPTLLLCSKHSCKLTCCSWHGGDHVLLGCRFAPTCPTQQALPLVGKLLLS